MSLYTLLLFAAPAVLFILLIPDLFPRCSLCGKIKPRPCFSIHKAIRLKLGYAANRSVCRKCAKRYEIHSIRDYEHIQEIRRKLRIRSPLE